MADTHAKFFRPAAVSPGYDQGNETAKQIDEAKGGANGGAAAGSNGTFSDGASQPAATFGIN